MAVDNAPDISETESSFIASPGMPCTTELTSSCAMVMTPVFFIRFNLKGAAIAFTALARTEIDHTSGSIVNYGGGSFNTNQ
jgi:hypothetical protein